MLLSPTVCHSGIDSYSAIWIVICIVMPIEQNRHRHMTHLMFSYFILILCFSLFFFNYILLFTFLSSVGWHCLSQAVVSGLKGGRVNVGCLHGNTHKHAIHSVQLVSLWDFHITMFYAHIPMLITNQCIFIYFIMLTLYQSSAFLHMCNCI